MIILLDHKQAARRMGDYSLNFEVLARASLIAVRQRTGLFEIIKNRWGDQDIRVRRSTIEKIIAKHLKHETDSQS